MKNKLRVGIKFCGNCNPHISVREVALEIREMARQEKLKIIFLPWYVPGWEVLLVISGCPRDCVGRLPGDLDEISVAGETVNSEPCTREGIPRKVIGCLLKYQVGRRKPDQSKETTQ